MADHSDNKKLRKTKKLLELLDKEVRLDGETLSRLLANEKLDKLSLIAEHSNDVICLHHPEDGRYLYASPSTERIMGYTPKDLEGKVPYDYIHPDHLQILSDNLSHTRDGANVLPERLELLFRKKDGNYQWFEGYSTPIHDSQGRVILMLTSTRNIQDRKRVEREKREKELIKQSLASHALLLEKKQAIMRKLKDRVLQVEPEIREELRDILSDIKETLRFSEHLEIFIERFKQIHPDFYNKIQERCPKLTPSELQHLAYLRLGMNSSEISKIMSVQKQSLRVMRARLKKKLALKEDESLISFVAQVSIG